MTSLESTIYPRNLLRSNSGDRIKLCSFNILLFFCFWHQLVHIMVHGTNNLSAAENIHIANKNEFPEINFPVVRGYSAINIQCNLNS